VAAAVLARRRARAAVLAVTHDFGFAAEVLDRAVVLGGTRITHDAPLTDLLGRHPEFPAPPLVELTRRLAMEWVRPSIDVMAPLLTSHPEPRTL
jgi:ABC-type glutathione transport system ATPase component